MRSVLFADCRRNLTIDLDSDERRNGSIVGDGPNTAISCGCVNNHDARCSVGGINKKTPIAICGNAANKLSIPQRVLTSIADLLARVHLAVPDAGFWDIMASRNRPVKDQMNVIMTGRRWNVERNLDITVSTDFYCGSMAISFKYSSGTISRALMCVDWSRTLGANPSL